MKKSKIPSDIRITIIYVVLAASWILFSNKILLTISSDINEINRFELLKGFFFVIVTGILLYLLIHHELRRRNNILKELQESKKQAEESDRLKSAFLSNISHYLRTPMNSILGFVDLLQNRNLDEQKQQRFLSIVNEQSNHLLQFINNIIEISKLQGGQVGVTISEFSMNELLRKLQIRYQTELELYKKKNSVQLKGIYLEKDVVLRNDQEKIEYILTNLLSNAVKFTKEGEVTFGYTLKQDMVEFYVKDTGIGIPPEKQGLITKTFMLSDPDVNQENIGIGLGLSITNGLVNLLHGRLWLEKSDHLGTEFRFVVPINLHG